MVTVELQFANATYTTSFQHASEANAYANGLLEMYKGEEKWFDKERNCYIVTAHHMEIVK